MENVHQQIRETMMNECSEFVFLDGCEYELSKSTTYSCSYSEVEVKVLSGYIAVSDYFLMYALICLGHATAEMVFRYVRKMKNKFPDMIIPGNDIDGVRMRLKILANYGVIRGFTYKARKDDSTGINVYCIADCGAKLVQRGLCKDFVYDALCSAETTMLVLRRAACNFVGTVMLSNKLCYEYMAKMEVHLGKGEKMQSYGRLYYKVGEEGNEKKYLAFIEPMFFSIDSRIMDAKSNIAKMTERLGNYDKHLKFLKDKYEEICLIICVENWEGLVKSVQIINKSAPELLDKCFFVCDRVLYLNDRDVNKSFLHLALGQKDGKLVISSRQAEHPVFFPDKEYFTL